MSALSSKGFQYFPDARFIVNRPAASSLSDGLHAATRLGQIIVYDHVIVIRIMLQFQAGPVQTRTDFIIRILAASADTFFEFLTRGRQDENPNRVRKLALHLFRTLHINLEDQVQFTGTGFLKPFLRRAVTVFSENAGEFEKFAAFGHVLKVFL